MKDLVKDTIGKIKKEHIVPESKWKFLIRKHGMWTMFGLIVVFGAISFSVAYHVLAGLDWDLYRFMHQNAFAYSLSILPYFWVILIVIFLAGAFLDIRKTETGYRFSLLKMSLMVIGGVFVLGLLMSLVGLGKRVHLAMNKSVPYYGQHMMVTKETQWNNPAEGFLAGTIISISGNELALKDLQTKRWNVELDEKTLIRPRAEMSAGQMIKVVGTMTGGNDFKAKEIRPWAGQGMMNGGRGMMRRN